MALINKIEKINKKWIYLIFAVLLIYTLIHFGYSGVYFPIKNPQLEQINGQLIPLIKFLQGEDFIITRFNPYGPFFILVMLPFMLTYNYQIIFYISLLIFNYLLIGIAFYICYKYIPINDSFKKYFFWILLFSWLNFSPLLYLITVKNVEIWELSLICLGFLAYIKRKYCWTGFTFAAATLIKFIPGLFLIYFIFKNRKVFYWTIISAGIIIITTHSVFGPDAGFSYVLIIIKNILQSRTWAVLWYENVAIKGFVYKIFGGFTLSETSHYFTISQEVEKIAFIITLIIQIIIISYIIWIAFKKNCSKEELIIQFSLVSIFMLLMSPITALEYNTLALFAYSAGIYFLIYKNISKYLYFLYSASYFLIGNFIPFSIFIKLFPIKTLNNFFGIKSLVPAEAYKAYCFPLLGMILLAVFFILIWNNKKILNKTEITEKYG